MELGLSSRVLVPLLGTLLVLELGCKPSSASAPLPAATGRPSSTPAPTATATPVPWPLPPGITEPVPIKQVRPVYPGTTTKHPWGVVVLDIVVTSEGVVSDIRVTKSEDALLERAAIDAVKQWRYRPAVRGGQPVAVHLPVSISLHPL
jgi:periplasmic protein TonB